MRLLHPYLLSFQATVSRQYISSLVLFQVLVCDLCVLCLSLRQRGDWGRQCRGQSERSIPAHYWQSADAFRTVAQAGATCVRALENASQKTRCKHVARLQDHRTSRGASLDCKVPNVLYFRDIETLTSALEEIQHIKGGLAKLGGEEAVSSLYSS